MRHQTIQIPHHHIGHKEGLPVMLKHSKARKVHTAHRNHRGVRLHLDHDEARHTVQHGGSIWGDIWNGIKTAGNWVKNNVIDTPVYQQAIKPVVRSLVDSTVKPFVDSYTGPLGGQAVDALGSATGAYGLRHKRHHKDHHAHHGGSLKKGSVEAREHMARLRAMRHHKQHGGSFLAS